MITLVIPGAACFRWPRAAACDDPAASAAAGAGADGRRGRSLPPCCAGLPVRAAARLRAAVIAVRAAAVPMPPRRGRGADAGQDLRGGGERPGGVLVLVPGLFPARLVSASGGRACWLDPAVRAGGIREHDECPGHWSRRR